MKLLSWTLIFSLAMMPGFQGLQPNVAQAETPRTKTTETKTDGSVCVTDYDVISCTTPTNTNSNTNSNTNTNTNTGSGTKTCTDNRGTYQGFSDNNCYNMSQNTTNNNQENTQKDTEKTNDSGSKQSSMLGMMAIAGGMGMIATGISMMSNLPTQPAGAALMAAGAALLAAGMMGMAAAGEMANDAGTAGYNAGNMANYNPYGPTNFKTGTGTGTNITTNTDPKSTVVDTNIKNKQNTPGIKIDPNLLRTGKSSAIFDEFEQKTGMSRDALAEALANGQSPEEIMAGNKNFGGQSAEALKATLGDAAASYGNMSSEDAMAKLGLSPEDLAALAKNTGAGDDSAYGAGSGAGGSAASRTPASATNFDGMFGGPKADLAGNGIVGDAMKLSPEIQAALDRNGISNRSIFQMVTDQYKKKTPMMFGVPFKKTGSNPDNPFGNLGGSGKVEL